MYYGNAKVEAERLEKVLELVRELKKPQSLLAEGLVYQLAEAVLHRKLMPSEIIKIRDLKI